MDTLWVELLPLIIGAAVLPIWIIIGLLLLRGEGGLRKAAAFSAGAIAVRLVQGLLFGRVFGAAAEDGGAAESGAIASTLLLVVGIVLLITAVRKWRKEEDPDAPPPRWMATLDGMSAARSFGMGALLMALAVKQWVFTLSAIAVIEQAGLSQSANQRVYLVFVLAAQSLVLAPVVVSALAPTRSAALLGTLLGWLERNNRTITIAVSSVFGVWFLGKGIAGLMG